MPADHAVLRGEEPHLNGTDEGVKKRSIDQWSPTSADTWGELLGCSVPSSPFGNGFRWLRTSFGGDYG